MQSGMKKKRRDVHASLASLQMHSLMRTRGYESHQNEYPALKQLVLLVQQHWKHANTLKLTRTQNEVLCRTGNIHTKLSLGQRDRERERERERKKERKRERERERFVTDI